MKDRENILSLLQVPIDYIGFIFYPKSPRFLTDEEVKKIQDIDFGNVKKVGVFVNGDEKEMFEIALALNLEYLQLCGDETRTQVRRLKKAGFKVIKAFGIHDDFDFKLLNKYAEFVEFFIFDTKSPNHGGSGQKFDWRILEKYKLDAPFMLSGGIGAEDAEAIKKVQHPQLMGLDLNSKFEISPALKDINLLKGFLKNMENGF